uniref:WW domain-containing protein n=1 Tax=Syphacia muris TaxID=451379 RepID=A0A158R4Z0_9BILA
MLLTGVLCTQVSFIYGLKYNLGVRNPRSFYPQMPSKEKVSVDVPGLLKPWKAYKSSKHNGRFLNQVVLFVSRIFYFNTATGESSWEMPTAFKIDGTPDGFAFVYTKKKKTKEEGTLFCHRNFRNSKKDNCNCSVTTSNENLMEVDAPDGECALVSSTEEPMEVDVVGEINAYRQENIAVASIFARSPLFALIKGHDVLSTVQRKAQGRSVTLIVVDTCILLQDVLVLKRGVLGGLCLLVPYIVLKELDGLKTKGTDQIRAAVRQVINFLWEFSLKYTERVFFQSFFECSQHQKYLKQFGCSNNDDMVMMSALMTKVKCKADDSKVFVCLATSDKNLALKCKATQLTVFLYEASKLLM